MGNLSTNEYFMTWDRGIDGYCWWLEYLGELKSTKYTVQICLIVVWWYWSTNLRGLSFDQMGFNQVGVNQQCMSMVNAPAFFSDHRHIFSWRRWHSNDFWGAPLDNGTLFGYGWWEILQETSIFDGKKPWFPVTISPPKPIHWYNLWRSSYETCQGTTNGSKSSKLCKCAAWSMQREGCSQQIMRTSEYSPKNGNRIDTDREIEQQRIHSLNDWSVFSYSWFDLIW